MKHRTPRERTRMRWLASAALALAFGLAGAARADDKPRWTVAPDVHIDIELVSGRIEIEGWDSNEVELDVKSEDLDAFDIEVSDEWVRIRGHRHGLGWLRGGGNRDVELRVPRGAWIQAQTMNGAIKVEQVDGEISARSGNGKIEVKGAPREVRLETVTGAIQVEGRDTRADVRTMGGSIQLEGVAGDVFASAMSGKIEVEAGVVQDLELRTMSGSIEFEGALADRARAHLQSYSGSIEVELPQDTSARFSLRSVSGSLKYELGDSQARGGRRAGERLEFSAGDGGSRVEIETLSGSIKIEER